MLIFRATIPAHFLLEQYAFQNIWCNPLRNDYFARTHGIIVIPNSKRFKTLRLTLTKPVHNEKTMRSSSHQRRPFLQTLKEAIGLFLLHWARRKSPISFGTLDAAICEYNRYLLLYRKLNLNQLRTVEIGFGARPFRLIWLYNNGVDVRGIDLDEPLLKPTLSSLYSIFRKNGPVRAIKSILRYYISDKAEWLALAQAINARGLTFNVPVERLIVADASDAKVWNSIGSVDFVYSEDVFEHIPYNNLVQIVDHMADHLAPDGIALIRPMIFTGICGGHQLEWYPHTIGTAIIRATEPWEHLRKNRDPAATFLNGLRLKDYVEIFSRRFTILEQKVMRPDLEREYMSKEIRDELKQYSDDELFSNNVLFVMRLTSINHGAKTSEDGKTAGATNDA